MKEAPIVIAGAGVAGLSAAYRLHKAGEDGFVVFEKAAHVGGYCRTMRYRGHRFDLGGHRFYTRKENVTRVVDQVLGDDRIEVDRVSRILFRGKFIDYPLSGFNALRGLGVRGAARATLDYATVKLRNALSAREPEVSFEQWALNRFGCYLYEVYFRVYTEKVWGVPCSELSADFAEQRIKGLSFREAVKDAILRRGSRSASLVRRFVYARRGFGQITDGLAAPLRGSRHLQLEHAVVRVEHENGRIDGVVARGPDGAAVRQDCRSFISSLPLDELIEMLEPAPPAHVLAAARALRYRDMVILFLALGVEQVSPDHWIYVPSPEIGLGRIHEPRNWSPQMAPPGKTGLVVEYFCREGDEYWRRDATSLASEAMADLAKMGLVSPDWLEDCMVVRLRKAYPVYNIGYEDNMRAVRGYLDRFGNLHRVGRNATFLYTSSDHYIDMGLKAAENALGHNHDLHRVGRERGYAEDTRAGVR